MFGRCASLCACVAAACTVLCLQGQVKASPTNDYNLIVFGDYYSTSQVAGRAIIGGSLLQTSVYAAYLQPSAYQGRDTLTVGGNINGVAIVCAGNLRVGGQINGQALTYNGRVIHDSGIDLSGLEAQLKAESASYAGLAANSTYALPGSQPTNVTFNAQPSGTGSLAVFDLSADFFSNGLIQQIDLALNGTDTVLFNVSGTRINFDSSSCFTGSLTQSSVQSKILWNFYEAEEIDLGSHLFYGSILAPYAEITASNHILGTVAAESMYTYGAVNMPTFAGNLPEPATVPVPGAFALVLTGGLFLRRRRRPA